MDTLTSLQEKALATFEDFFLSIKARSGDTITLRTATDIATAITTGLFAPLYSQVDPLHIGEAGRALRIAGQYGERLLNYGQNIGSDELQHIMTGYPSHNFVIDRAEASLLFEDVREPTIIETLLAKKLGRQGIVPNEFIPQGGSTFRFLSSELPNTSPQIDESQTKGTELDKLQGLRVPYLGELLKMRTRNLRRMGAVKHQASRPMPVRQASKEARMVQPDPTKGSKGR